MQKTKLPTRSTYYEDYVAEQKQRAALREAAQPHATPGSDRALATAAQYEFAALKLRQAAHELEATQLNGVENVSYWEWKSKQEDARDRHQPFNALPLEFTHWLLLDEAQQLDVRARELRGGR